VPTGSTWADPHVRAAARTAGFLRLQRDRLRLAALECCGSGSQPGSVVLWTVDGSRILWGRPPGEEGVGEATAVLKRDRLLLRLGQLAETGQGRPMQPFEHDLRPATGALFKPLSEPIQVGAR
jgi:hypothetical protein